MPEHSIAYRSIAWRSNSMWWKRTAYRVHALAPRAHRVVVCPRDGRPHGHLLERRHGPAPLSHLLGLAALTDEGRGRRAEQLRGALRQRRRRHRLLLLLLHLIHLLLRRILRLLRLFRLL